MLGDLSVIGEDETGNPLPSGSNQYCCSAPPALGPFNPVYEQLQEAADLFHGLTVTEPGFDQYDGKRRGGWMPEDRVWKTVGKNSSAPNRTERKVVLRVRVIEPSLDLLEREEMQSSWQQLYSGNPYSVNTVNAKRDISTYEEDDLTTTEVEKAVERVVQRENEKLRVDIIDAIAASTRFDPVAEAETYTEEGL